jgi:hypothetical protein
VTKAQSRHNNHRNGYIVSMNPQLWADFQSATKLVAEESGAMERPGEPTLPPTIQPPSVTEPGVVIIKTEDKVGEIYDVECQSWRVKTRGQPR